MTLWVLPNLAVAGAHLTARATLGGAQSYPGVAKFVRLDDRVWRGANPTMEGYRQLAADGVTTVVDLRAEGPTDLQAQLAPLGLTVVQIPVRDGQSPTPHQVDQFREVARSSPGIVFVHCGAGVGRTGVMAAAQLSADGDGAGRLLTENLALGTPSLEQLYTVATLDDGETERAPAVVVAASRVVDAPRRIMHVLGW